MVIAMRLDKFLCDGNCGTRSQVKKDIRAGLVTVNGERVRKPERQIDENADTIVYQGRVCVYEKYSYYMLHKPSGVLSATKDAHTRTVLDLLKAEDRRENLFPAGRLDKDTEGLILITNDGELSHALLSPRRHVEKEYECHLNQAITQEQIRKLEAGVDIGEERATKPAKVNIVSGAGDKVNLTITEGKFHQVKRMFQAVGSEVVYLKRIRIGTLVLDEGLLKGSYRRLRAEEIESLKEMECQDD